MRRLALAWLGTCALQQLAGRGGAQEGCRQTALTCVCEDDDGDEWDVNSLRGEKTTTGERADGGEWEYRLDLCGNVDADDCALSVQALREYQPDSECEMLALAQDDARPGVRKIPGGAREGIELAFTYGTGANERTFTLELECDEDGGDEEPGEVEGDGNDVSAVWLTDAACGAGPGPPPGPDPDPDPDPEPEPGPCVSPSPSSFSLAWECA